MIQTADPYRRLGALGQRFNGCRERGQIICTSGTFTAERFAIHGRGDRAHDRKIAAGKTPMEAMRALKRRLSDIPRRQMITAARAAVTGPGRTPGGGYWLQRGRLAPQRRHFGEVTSRARRQRQIGGCAGRREVVQLWRSGEPAVWGAAAACPPPRTARVAFGSGPGHSRSMPVTDLGFTAALARYARRFRQVAGTRASRGIPAGSLAIAGAGLSMARLR